MINTDTILRALTDGNSMRVRRLANLTNMPVAECLKQLAVLIRSGLVVKTGAGIPSMWTYRINIAMTGGF